MKHFMVVFTLVLFGTRSYLQVPYNAAVPNGYTKKAIVSEQVGLTQISITYHRPAVNGREGNIWGGIVHRGFIDQGFGNRKAAPWRAGANENTVIEFDNDVKIEGRVLPKGKYGFFIAYDPLECSVIFSKRSEDWGSFFYEEVEDMLRVKVKPTSLDKSVEYLKYEFTDQTQNSALVTLSWEKVLIALKVEVDYFKQQFDAFKTESQNPAGFTSQGLTIAANWCLQNNYQLETALAWSTLASGKDFPGDPTSFAALLTKATILEKLGKSQEGTTVLQNALPFGNITQLQQLGKQLLSAKKEKAALDVFRFNYNKHPGEFITVIGMSRGLSANGDYAKALEFASKALPLAPNNAGKQAVEGMIEKLKAGKDIN